MDNKANGDATIRYIIGLPEVPTLGVDIVIVDDDKEVDVIKVSEVMGYD